MSSRTFIRLTDQDILLFISSYRTTLNQIFQYTKHNITKPQSWEIFYYHGNTNHKTILNATTYIYIYIYIYIVPSSIDSCGLSVQLKMFSVGLVLFGLAWFSLVLWDIKHCRLFNAKYSLYIYIKYIWFLNILSITFLNEPKLILLQTVKWFQVFLCITNNSLKHQSLFTLS